MMTLLELQHRMDDLGIICAAVGGKLRVELPADGLDPELQAAIARYKPFLLKVAAATFPSPPDYGYLHCIGFWPQSVRHRWSALVMKFRRMGVPVANSEWGAFREVVDAINRFEAQHGRYAIPFKHPQTKELDPEVTAQLAATGMSAEDFDFGEPSQ